MRKPRSSRSNLQRRISRFIATAFTGGGAIILGHAAPAAAQGLCLADVQPSLEFEGLDSTRADTISVHVDPFNVRQAAHHDGTGHMTVQLRFKDGRYGADIKQWLDDARRANKKVGARKLSLVLLNADGSEARRWVFEGTMLEALADNSLHLTNGDAGTSADGLTELSLAFDSFADVPGRAPPPAPGDPSTTHFGVTIADKPSANAPGDTSYSLVTGGGDVSGKNGGPPTPVVLQGCLTSGRPAFADWLADSLDPKAKGAAAQRTVTITTLDQGKPAGSNIYSGGLIEEYVYPELHSHDHNTLKEKITIRPERHDIQ